MGVKKQVLFVDDEPNIILGLKRMLYSQRVEWDTYYALSGPEALEVLAARPIDIIISDMRMPGMDGAELLDQVMEAYPNIIRIVLSGHSDKEMILRSTKAAHQFLVKPCDADDLKRTVEKALALRYFIKDEELIKTITGKLDLPSVPDLYDKLLIELNADDPSLKKIGEIIAQDIIMTAKILQFVNSAFFGLPRKVNLAQQAIPLLGINNLKALVFYQKVFSITSAYNQIWFVDELWQHSVMVGTLAREIAMEEARDKTEVDIDDALTTGILHDIGKLILLKIPHYHQRVLKISRERGLSLVEAEYEILGVSHAEIGAYLLNIWGFSDSIIELVAFHHLPAKSTNPGFTIVTAVHAANGLLLSEADNPPLNEARYLDLNYLKGQELLPRLDHWRGIARRLIQRLADKPKGVDET